MDLAQLAATAQSVTYPVLAVYTSIFFASLLPRLGPGRALTLGLSSRFSRATRVSQRAPELLVLQRLLAQRHRCNHIMVYGPAGVGE